MNRTQKREMKESQMEVCFEWRFPFASALGSIEDDGFERNR